MGEREGWVWGESRGGFGERSRGMELNEGEKDREEEKRQ